MGFEEEIRASKAVVGEVKIVVLLSSIETITIHLPRSRWSRLGNKRVYRLCGFKRSVRVSQTQFLIKNGMLRITSWQLHHIPFGEPPFI